LGCRVVCGGANNQLAEARHDTALAARGIVFVPDYLANAGGVIDFHQATIDDQPDAVLASVSRIGAITRDVLRCAAATGATPLSVADGIVRARIRRASLSLNERELADISQRHGWEVVGPSPLKWARISDVARRGVEPSSIRQNTSPRYKIHF
jgi:glutamate dehydrogenase/leucine dehydrogenase